MNDLSGFSYLGEGLKKGNLLYYVADDQSYSTGVDVAGPAVFDAPGVQMQSSAFYI